MFLLWALLQLLLERGLNCSTSVSAGSHKVTLSSHYSLVENISLPIQGTHQTQRLHGQFRSRASWWHLIVVLLCFLLPPILSSLLEPCLCASPHASLALAPVLCSSPATSACQNHPALFASILPKLQQIAFTNQAQSAPWISRSGVSRGRDVSWHLVTPSNSADEIPGAASHTPAPCGHWCSSTSFCPAWNYLWKCSSSFTSLISELNLPLPHKTNEDHQRCFGTVHLCHRLVLTQPPVCAVDGVMRAQTSPPLQKVRPPGEGSQQKLHSQH